ncbi:hypothetical protein CSOJ01_14386 [Colletotrichum sojae]|uniref:F-box domain-containing protein n=1 Tax=Colletotrichum sojae TaxID=2175907 RepID=A0A8H6IQS0_9PEZI|nr:hypothetical protein CSOJ01_14386 [Colletotrichum sojae]
MPLPKSQRRKRPSKANLDTSPGNKRPRYAKKSATATTKSVNINDLPNELIWDIVKRVDENGNRKHLLSLSLSNKLFHSFAQEELYRHFEIRNPNTYRLLTRTLIENPPVRALVRKVAVNLTGYSGFYRMQNACADFKSWPGQEFNESKLSTTDRHLLMLTKVVCGTNGNDNARCVLALCLLLLSRAEDVTLELDFFSRPSSRVLVTGLQMLAPSQGTGAHNFHHAPVFPAAKNVHLTGGTFVWLADTVFHKPFHLLPSLLAPANLIELSLKGDENRWNILDDVEFNRHLSLQSVRLEGSKSDASGLCRLLRRCPDLKRLQVALRYRRTAVADKDQASNINDVLLACCPKLEVLSLCTEGGSDRFFRQRSRVLTCLANMNNLRDLRISLDCFFDHPTTVEMLASHFSDMLPPNVEKLGLDATWALRILNGKASANNPDAQAYKRGMERLIKNLCEATKMRLVRLKHIVIGFKFGKPVQWTREAEKLLAGTDVKISLKNTTASHMIWQDSWESMFD